MAQAVLGHRLRQRGSPAIVESAGLAALVGRPADPFAQDLMRARGLDISHHRARQLTSEVLRSFELVLVMETTHQRVIEAEYPVARGRVHRLGRMGGFDIPDPYRQGRAAFEHALELIDRGIVELDQVLWSKSP
jgi:protein-tyrosine phosphatase